MNVKVYTDGSARGNPDGPGGYGTVLKCIDNTGQEHIREYSGGFKKTTNNRMELLAVIIGIEALTKPSNVEVISDSKYVTDAFNKNWIDNWQAKNWITSTKKPVKNIDLWKRLLKAKAIHEVVFTWVKGHAGHEENERCDVLATTAADGNDLMEDVNLSVT